MRVRRLEERDLGALQPMIDGLAAFHGDKTVALSKQDLEDLAGPDPWFIVMVAEAKSGDLLGYAALTRIGQLQYAQRAMDMHHLFVCAGHRGNGIGTALVHGCFDLARRSCCHILTVGTHPENENALQFYESLGFVQRPWRGHRLAIRIQPPT